MFLSLLSSPSLLIWILKLQIFCHFVYPVRSGIWVRLLTNFWFSYFLYETLLLISALLTEYLVHTLGMPSEGFWKWGEKKIKSIVSDLLMMGFSTAVKSIASPSLVFQINPRHSHYPWPLKDPEILLISICLQIYKLKMLTHWKQFFFRLLRNLNFGNRKHLLFKIYNFLKEKKKEKKRRNCHLHGSFKFNSTYFQFDMPIIKTIINPWHLFTRG